MRKQNVIRKAGGAVCIIALALAQFVPCNIGENVRKQVKAAESETVQITVDPAVRSSFHDTDGDGYGEFQGFGTSLCWWANRVGYSNSLTEQAAKAFYSMDSGLGMTIGRYNAGGGDDPSHDHITRSDSVVPGYAKDVTKISSEKDAQGFDQFDVEAGYAWNYDWDADKRQLNVLTQAAQYAGADFLGEIFSNSPPYFLTKSGCSSGGEGGADNLKENCHTAFSKYLADVTKHLLEKGYRLSSIEPVNEPSNGWSYLSSKQEGCKMEPDTLSKLYPVVDQTLKNYGLDDLILAGCDYGSTTDTKTYFNKLSEDAQSVIERMDVHCYTYTNNSMTFTREKAESAGMNLWMSEVDGSYAEGTNAGEMSAALGLSQNMSRQMNGLMPSAWILWDAVDIHVDAQNKFDRDSMSGEDYKNLDEKGFWGIAVADHNSQKLVLTKKYYGMGQYSRYIRPGDTLVGSSVTDNKNVFATAAYAPGTGKIVIVVTNTSDQEQACAIDLSKFQGISSKAALKTIRTSGTLDAGENLADVSGENGTSWNIGSRTIQTALRSNSITTYVLEDTSVQDPVQPSETVKVTVKKVTGLKVKGQKKKLKVTFKAQKDVTYRIAYSTDKKKLAKIKDGKIKAVSGTKVLTSKKTSVLIKKLKAKKKYYVKVCAVGTDKKTIGKWSKTVSAKTKK